jgi:SRSO17 transposase
MIAVTLWLEGFALMTTPREPHSTISFVDQYCSAYQHLFADVRTFERFKSLQLGLLSEVKRKTLPAMARAVGADAQAFHHFLVHSPWSVESFREQRIALTKQALNGRSITVCIDETGDKKKGKKTDYVSRQYIGNVGKIDNGIVSVHAFGLLENITFPLLFRVFKPECRLAENEQHKSKPKIAADLIDGLCERGFNIGLVVADSHYGESSDFINTLWKHRLHYVVAIRSNHRVWMLKGWVVRRNCWKSFERQFSNGKTETRHIREIIFGKRKATRYYQITTDSAEQPEESTWYVMTNLPGKIEKTVGNLFGDRTWVEYGFRQVKAELGWTDYKLTAYPGIEKWWEMVCSAYLMVSMQTTTMRGQLEEVADNASQSQRCSAGYINHKWWDAKQGWKASLNNMRLMIQPFVCLSVLLPWLEVSGPNGIGEVLHSLIDKVNGFAVCLRL